MGYSKVSVEKDENVLEMDGDNDCKTMWMCLMPENLETVKKVNFILCMFFNNKKGLKNEVEDSMESCSWCIIKWKKQLKDNPMF